MKFSVTYLTENQCFASPGGHELDPLRFLSAVICFQIFESTDMVDLKFVGYVGCSADVTDLG